MKLVPGVIKPEVGRAVRALSEAESAPGLDVFEVSSAQASQNER